MPPLKKSPRHNPQHVYPNEDQDDSNQRRHGETRTTGRSVQAEDTLPGPVERQTKGYSQDLILEKHYRWQENTHPTTRTTFTRISREEYPDHELRIDPTSSSIPASDRLTNPTAALVREKRLHGWNRFDVWLNLRNCTKEATQGTPETASCTRN